MPTVTTESEHDNYCTAKHFQIFVDDFDSQMYPNAMLYKMFDSYSIPCLYGHVFLQSRESFILAGNDTNSML